MTPNKIFKAKRKSIGEAVQLTQTSKAQLRFEVSSMKVKISAPLDLVWDAMEASEELEWNPFSRVYTLIKRAGHPVSTPFADGRRTLNAQQCTKTVETYESERICRTMHELPPWEKGVKCYAESVHTLRQMLDEDGDEATEYELTESFYTTQQCWNKDMNPGVMEKGAREFAAALRRCAEELVR